MKLEQTKDKIVINLEAGEEIKDIQIADRNYGESTKQIWIKLKTE